MNRAARILELARAKNQVSKCAEKPVEETEGTILIKSRQEASKCIQKPVDKTEDTTCRRSRQKVTRWRDFHCEPIKKPTRSVATDINGSRTATITTNAGLINSQRFE